MRRPRRFTLFPYTTLFRSKAVAGRAIRHAEALQRFFRRQAELHGRRAGGDEDRKSTRLNSSHVKISYAVFCLKKKTIVSREKSPLDPAVITVGSIHGGTKL